MVPEALDSRPPLLVIMGPTATGKTEIALGVAQQLGGEIISADSMQVYKRLDAGTAKPTAKQRQMVPHHLVDFLEPGEPFSVAAYKQLAQRTICDVGARGKLPVLVGGSGLYIRAVVQDLQVDLVPPDPDYRRRLERVAGVRGVEHLHKCLSRLDPELAAPIHPNDLRRVIRALELVRADRKPVRPGGAGMEDVYRTCKVVLHLPRRALYQRIDQRVDRMMAQGWLEEVAGLVEAGLTGWLTSSQALGYGILAQVVAGELRRCEAVETIKRETRRLAKRQLTWFRREPNAHWIRADCAALPVITTLVAGTGLPAGELGR